MNKNPSMIKKLLSRNNVLGRYNFDEKQKCCKTSKYDAIYFTDVDGKQFM
jgi:hypothetical protein